jgi:hypothetical protein
LVLLLTWLISRVGGNVDYWQASHVGSSIAQNFGSSRAAAVEAGAALPDAWRVFDAAPLLEIPPEAGTEFSSPPRPVDFSADVAASVRR